MLIQYKPGQVVCLTADTSRQGSVLQILPSLGGRARYRVFHSAQETRDYYGDQLSLVSSPTDADPGIEALRHGGWLAIEDFRARLTAARLANPLTDSLYSLHAARIKFIPFQFKPLLRFLRSDRPRLLIADEVGVGKTIEAGLILKELQSRQKVENVIIVCPKALVSKWRAEMRRFDETFHALDASTLRYCLNQTHLEGAWPSQYSRVIVHLELFRNPDYLFGTTGRNARPGLASLDPLPQFSLAVFDEAHHLRNPATNGNQLAKFICDASEAVVFLSATPVQLGSRNLFTLLSLLRPDLFLDEKVFDEMVAPNKFITSAMRHVRTRVPHQTWQADSARVLATAALTPWGQRILTQDPRFVEWSQALQAQAPLSDVARIRCLRDLEEVHTLAHVMNRTRRRDIGRFTTREPRTVSVKFTEPQEAFYRALIAFRVEMLQLDHDPIVVRLIIDMLERQAASCLPALVPTLDQFLRTGRFSASQVSDDIDDEDEVEFPQGLRTKAASLRSQAAQLPHHDPKLEGLFALANATREGAGPGKLLIFSFFLHTLSYLGRHLLRAGYRVGIVTGKVEESERENLRNRFRKPRADSDSIDILLSSEVGCEGLDYEFCDRLVNYDIPWNPMRLEQRIGRIDRFGQASEKVLIFNFITPGTVEERIFFRCFERLGVFRDTVGDCEEVMGEFAVAEELLKIARNPSLTPEQAEARSQQIADNVVRKLEEQRRLETEAGDFLGIDQAFTSEVEAVSSEGRFVSADELREMVACFVECSDVGGSLQPASEHSSLFRLRLNQEARLKLARQLRDFEQRDRSTVEFRRWLEGSDPHLILTFDQTVALERREIPFVTPVHPLARMATKAMGAFVEPLVSMVAVCSNEAPPGAYVFVCQLWETIAANPDIRLRIIAWDLNTGTSAPHVASLLLKLVREPQSTLPVAMPLKEHLDRALVGIEEEIHNQREAAFGELTARNDTLVTNRLAVLETYHVARLRRIEHDILVSTDPRIRNMKEGERNRATADFLRRQAEIERRRRADIVTQRIALGVLEIHRA